MILVKKGLYYERMDEQNLLRDNREFNSRRMTFDWFSRNGYVSKYNEIIKVDHNLNRGYIFDNTSSYDIGDPIHHINNITIYLLFMVLGTKYNKKE